MEVSTQTPAFGKAGDRLPGGRGYERMGSRREKKRERVALAVYLEPELAAKLKTIATKERRSASMQAAVFIERGVLEHP